MSENRQQVGRRLVRWLKWGLPIALVAGAIALAFAPRAVEVEVGEVSRGPMRVSVDEDGMTRVRERYVVSAPLAGRLRRVGLDAGDAVERGAVVAVLDPGDPALLDPRVRAEAEARVKAAEAAVARATEQLGSARADAEVQEKAFLRGRELVASGNLSEAAFEETEGRQLAARHAVSGAVAAVKMATFELEQARAALAFSDGKAMPDGDIGAFPVKSPVEGRVLRVFEESSTVVPAGARLLEVGDPRDLELRIDVLSQDAVKIRPGQQVVLEQWGGGRPLSARVRRVEPSGYTKVSALGVDEQRVDVIADFEGEPDEALGDGFRVEARIVVWEAESVLRVPVGAIFRSGDRWAVYRVDGDRAERVDFEAGRNNGDEVEVISGLEAGDRVILHPSDRIAEGTLVELRS